jgi:hypothetical protein
MKKFLKLVYSSSVTFMDTLVSIFSVLLFSRFYIFRNLRELIDKKHNHCYIIANGPSLKYVIEDKKESDIFYGQDVFTVNLLYQTPFFFELKPSNHIIADNAFWDTAWDSTIEGIQIGFKENLMNVTWEMNLFVPSIGYPIIKRILAENEKITLIPYNNTPVIGYEKVSYFLYRKNLGMPKPTNVLNVGIFLALNLGYSRLYIYGADHTWMKDLFVDEDNDICCYQNHFYDSEIVPYKMPKGSLAMGLKSIVEALESYSVLNLYAKSINARIINKTRGSYIDIFDKE